MLQRLVTSVRAYSWKYRWVTIPGKFAEIKVDYQKIHLGYFNTKEEAVQIRKDAELKYFGKYSSINSRDGIYDKLSLDEILEKENNEKEILSAQSANLY